MITMLKASRKPKRKREKQTFRYKANTKIRLAQKEAKVAVALRSLEYLSAVHEALDWVEEHFPDIKKTISEELDWIEKMENEYITKILPSVFVAKGDVNNLQTYAGRHFYKKELVQWREDIRKSISMRGVRNHHNKPYLLGASLLLLIALELEKQVIEVKIRTLSAAIKEQGTDITFAKYGAIGCIDTVCIPDYDKPVKKIIDKFQELVGMPDRVFEEYMLNDKIGVKVYDYSADYHAAYCKRDIIASCDMVKKENNHYD